MNAADKANRIPVIEPFILALKSRRVIIALVTLLVSFLVLAIPELAAIQTELLVLLVTFGLALIGGYSVEDAAAAGRGHAGEVTLDLEGNIRELIGGITDEVLDRLGGEPLTEAQVQAVVAKALQEERVAFVQGLERSDPFEELRLRDSVPRVKVPGHVVKTYDPSDPPPVTDFLEDTPTPIIPPTDE